MRPWLGRLLLFVGWPLCTGLILWAELHTLGY